MTAAYQAFNVLRENEANLSFFLQKLRFFQEFGIKKIFVYPLYIGIPLILNLTLKNLTYRCPRRRATREDQEGCFPPDLRVVDSTVSFLAPSRLNMSDCTPRLDSYCSSPRLPACLMTLYCKSLESAVISL